MWMAHRDMLHATHVPAPAGKPRSIQMIKLSASPCISWASGHAFCTKLCAKNVLQSKPCWQIKTFFKIRMVQKQTLWVSPSVYPAAIHCANKKSCWLAHLDEAAHADLEEDLF